MDLTNRLAGAFEMDAGRIANIIQLLDDGNTVPFIARYRKESTGSCDDQTLHAIAERLVYWRGLEKRKAEVAEAIAKQGKLTEPLRRAIEAASTLAEVEDIYLPFRPKRRTRASIAEEKGLRPLADRLIAQRGDKVLLRTLAEPYVDPEKGVTDWEEAVAGARDILAEDIAVDAAVRKQLRALLWREGLLRTQPGKKEIPVYENYRDRSEPVSGLPAHRILAFNRGEREEALRVRIEVDDEKAAALLFAHFVRPGSVSSVCVREAAEDAWKRLIRPSLEREIRADLTTRASEQAVSVFAINLRPLLLQPPLKGKTVLGLDPAYRTGCKAAVVDPTGKLLDTAVVYPTPPQNRTEEAKAVLLQLIRKHRVDAISIGNGTASRETEHFVADLVKENGGQPGYAIVNEAGASVYSASPTAAAEFPRLDVSLRSAVSIARRLQDPLAELVKIDPRSIGVGQYQHDLPPDRLGGALETVVKDCVNQVGADLNTASPELLRHISGLGASVAAGIVAYRNENGGFAKRSQLKDIPGLGPKTFVQSAGFLRIPGARNLLDNTAVHPESYPAAARLLALCGLTLDDLSGSSRGDAIEQLRRLDTAQAAAVCGIGEPTLRDMMEELLQPGRDVREALPPLVLRSDVMALEDLKPGMRLTGTVRNVIDFGAFVDLGVHEDGLVHISELCDRYIRHPSEVVQVGDVVQVTVLGVDAVRKRISLTMRTDRSGGGTDPDGNGKGRRG